MSRILRGYFNGTGATATLCLGVIPHRFVLQNVQVATNPETIEWDEAMQCEVLCYGGIYIKGSDGVRTKLTTTGCVPYNGGVPLTAALQTSTTYGEGVYLTWDHKNYQADYTYGSGTQGTPINRWTFVTGLTGYWNVAKVASGNRVGVGSLIRIKEDSTGLVKEACVTALTSDGEVSAEVTLSRAIGSGAITFLGGMYQLAPMAIGDVTLDGITLGSETTVNVNDDMLTFKAYVD
jgi:hypothetical protein